MSLKDMLMDDLKDAMKTKNEIKKLTVTMLRAAVKQVEVDTRTELDDEGIIEIVAKQVKQKNGAIEEFEKGGRPDLVDEAKAEIEVLMKYLPKQLGQAEIAEMVGAVIQEVGATSPKDMGKVMGILTARTKGVADGKTVSNVVKEMLSKL
jgi:uncharacterized protein